MASFFSLVTELETLLSQLNTILAGDENTTVEINGEDKPSIKKATVEAISNTVQLVIDAAADIDAVKYSSISAGIAATTDGKYFSVVSDNDESYLDLYKNEAGIAKFIKSYPTLEYIDAILRQINSERITVLDNSGKLNKGASILYTESGVPKAQSTTYAGYAVALTLANFGAFDRVDMHIQLDAPTTCKVYVLSSELNVLTSTEISAMDGWNSVTLPSLIDLKKDGSVVYIGIETVNRDPMTINTITPPSEYAETGTYPVKATPFANGLGRFTATVSSQYRMPVRLWNTHDLYIKWQAGLESQANRVAPILAESLTTAMSSSRGGELENTYTNFSGTFSAFATAYSTPADAFDSMRVYFISESDSAFRFYLKNDVLGDIEFVETEVLPAGPQSVVIALSKFYTSAELGSQFYVAIESINHVSRLAVRKFIDDESKFPQPPSDYPVKFMAADDDDNTNWIGGGSSIAFRLYVEFYDLSSVANALSVAVSNAESTASVRMAIPSNFYSIDGLNNQSIYYSNITKAASADDYLFDISAGLTGRMKAKSFQNRKVGAGTQTITAKLYNRNRVLLDETTSTLNQVTSSAGTGKTPTALCIGDSITARGFYTQDLLDLAGADVMGLNLIGTRGTAPNNHEGEGGKTVDWFYTDAASPFVFGGVFDFAQYMSTNGYSTLDYIFIHLGVNDVGLLTSDASAIAVSEAAMVQLEDMVTQFKAFSASVKIGLMLPIASSFDQDAFGIVYSDAVVYWRYNANRSEWCNIMIDTFDNRTGEDIFVLPTNCTIDVESGYNVADPIHPIDDGSGYEDMANTVWAFMKNKEG
tara:strand:+ start:7846 stop:10299 length:2454 start_codon:yes stop_codon:yes gene_type:complete